MTSPSSSVPQFIDPLENRLCFSVSPGMVMSPSYIIHTPSGDISARDWEKEHHPNQGLVYYPLSSPGRHRRPSLVVASNPTGGLNRHGHHIRHHRVSTGT